MSRVLLHLLIYLRALFYFDIKSHKIEHSFKTYGKSLPNKNVYKPNPQE